MPLRYLTWPGIQAGFHAEVDGRREDGLLHAGEAWAGGSWLVDWHEHPVWELYLQAHGSTRWQVRDNTYLVPPGAVLAVPPGAPHVLLGGPRARQHFFYAAFDAPALVDDAALVAMWSGNQPMYAPRAESLGSPFRTLVRELTAVRSWQGAALRAAATLLVVEASRVVRAGGDAPPPTPRAPSPAVQRARRLLDERPGERWRVTDLAAGSGLSATHLAALFTRDVGVPPHRYLLERRLERASELLAGSDLPITAVALEVGFASGPHLSRAFRAGTGRTPREYRRAARADNSPTMR